MTWWLALCALIAAVMTVRDLRSTHVGIGMGLVKVGKLARKWGLTTLTVMNVAGWLLLVIGGSLVADDRVRGACALVLLLMALAHASAWDRNSRTIASIKHKLQRIG